MGKMNLPVIPRSEYPGRWKLVQNLMEKENLDLLLIYADDHSAYGPAYARWLADFYVHFEPVCLLFSRENTPLMLVGPESPGYAGLNSVIADIRVLREFTHPDEDYPYCKIEGLSQIIDSLPGMKNIRRVGISGQSLISFSLLSAFKQVISAEWLNVDKELGMLRAVKTTAELKVIEYAYSVAEAGLAAAIAAVAPGVPERHIAAEAEYAMRKLGSEGMGIDTIVASGINAKHILARTTMREVAKDDVVILTIAPRYEGYHAAVALPVMVGNPPDSAWRALAAAVEAIKICSAKMRDGGDYTAEKAAREVMAKAGFAENFAYSGIHSVGVIEFEAPIFGPSCRDIMRENMVLSVDIPVFGADWGGLRVEDGFLLQKDQARRFTKFDYIAKK